MDDDVEESSDLTPLAEAISDGRPINWAAEGSTPIADQPSMDALRLIDSVARAHRLLHAPAGARGVLDVTTDRLDEGSAVEQNSTAPPPESATEIEDMPAIWGKLRLIERVGQGAFGEVYRAFDPSLRREVALKLMKPGAEGAAADRLIREARLLAKVDHPNVVTVHGADRHEGRAGLWTDLLTGETLEEILHRQGPFAANEAATIGMELCRAVAAVHAAGLVHRDIKTANVMRVKGGEYVLMDFGAAENLAGRRGLIDDALGTPIFMAPEVLRGGRADRAADIYSLGVVLFRLVTGRYPIEAKTWKELLDKHARHEVVALRDARSDVPPAFVQVVETALCDDPSRRHKSAGAMEAVLAQAIGVRAGESVARTDHPDRRAGRRGVLSLAISLAAAVAVTAGAYSLWTWLASPLAAEAALYRQRDGVVTKLKADDHLALDDEIFLRLKGNERMFVYVINSDEAGHQFVLFPNARFDLKNPLEPGVEHRLPGSIAGQDQSWSVTDLGGREHYIVVASRHQLPSLESELANHPSAEPGRLASLDHSPSMAADDKERGTGGMRPSSPAASTTTKDLDEAIRRILSRSARPGEVWTWRIDLIDQGTP